MRGIDTRGIFHVGPVDCARFQPLEARPSPRATSVIPSLLS